jgi:hypothetical protein
VRNCIAPRLQSGAIATDGHASVCGRIGSADDRHACWHPIAESVSRIIDVARQLISWAQAIEKTPHASMALREPTFVSSQVIKTRPRPTGCVAYVSNSRRAVDALPSGVPTAGPLLTVSSDPPVGCRDNVGPGNAAGCANSSCTLCPNPSRDATRSIYPTTATTDEPAFRQCASQTQRTRLEIASDSPHREGPPSIARGPCEASGLKYDQVR